jgi:E3 ubiquitin-protein ligase HUWE1
MNRYSNYDVSSPQIQWFWRAVRSFNKEERAKLLQFATGTSKVPLNGFKELEGMQGTFNNKIHNTNVIGTTKFTIVRDFGHKTRLPQSHTCFNQIDLPEYESYEQLRSALLTAITMGTEGFGFA